MADVFDRIEGQARVQSLLRAEAAAGRLAHAYLFSGPDGCGKARAATALAQALICESGGCCECPACKRIARGSHPDVRFLGPEGAGGYLVSQIRDVVADVSLAPIRADAKVYVIERAELLGVQAANAFLKTLEEPPGDATIVLTARNAGNVLPTLVSRCQVLSFRRIPEDEAADIVARRAGVDGERAAEALRICAGSVARAERFVSDPNESALRSRTIGVMEALRFSSDAELLGLAADLTGLSKAPLERLRAEQAEELEACDDFMSKAALARMEQRHKRALAAADLESMGKVTAVMRSWLRDVLMLCADASELVVNTDALPGLQNAASATGMSRIVRILRVLDETDEAIAYNVSPETCFDALLIQAREVLYGAGSARYAAI